MTLSIQIYPLTMGQGARLKFIKYDPAWWLNAPVRLHCPPDIWGPAHDLFIRSIYQDPAGTLPDDDAKLADFLGVDIEVWRGLRARGALTGWEPCRCLHAHDDPADPPPAEDAGGVIRLWNSAVWEAIRAGVGLASDNRNASARSRLSRLRDTVRGLGYGPPVHQDAMLMEWVDALLTERLPARSHRKPTVVREAVEECIARRAGPSASVLPLHPAQGRKNGQ